MENKDAVSDEILSTGTLKFAPKGNGNNTNHISGPTPGFEPYLISKTKTSFNLRLREEELPITAEQLSNILRKHL